MKTRRQAQAEAAIAEAKKDDVGILTQPTLPNTSTNQYIAENKDELAKVNEDTTSIEVVQEAIVVGAEGESTEEEPSTGDQVHDTSKVTTNVVQQLSTVVNANPTEETDFSSFD